MPVKTLVIRWEARPVPPSLPTPGVGRWGIVSLPAERWLAFGPEALCRRLVARLTGTVTSLTAPL